MAKKTMTIDDRLWNLVKDDFDMPRRQALRDHERDHVALGVVEPDGAGLWTKLTPRNALDLAAALTQYANDNLPTTKR